jgi:heptosyltransferase-1
MRILVIRLGAMGDILHALPAAATLKHGFPGSHLTWAVEPKWAPLLDENPFVDCVTLVRRRSAAELWRSWRDLRSRPYDLAVDFQGLIKSALVARASGAERIYGFDASQTREREAAIFYSNQIYTNSVHVIDRNLDLAAAAGATTALRAFPLPAGKPQSDLPDGGFVLASPLAGWRSKQWPAEYYGALAARLKRELQIPLVLDLAPGAAFPAVPDAVPHYSRLEGLIYATRRAAAVIGVDSGPMHLAAALGKPGVAIFGPTDPARNGPCGDSIRVLRSLSAQTTYKRGTEIDDSMRRVSPDEVFDALRPILRQRHADCLA